MSTSLLSTDKKTPIVVKEVISFPVDKASFYGYNVAVPAKGILIVNSNIEIAGWIVGKNPVRAIDIVLNNKVVKSIPVNVKRQDLSKLYGDLAERQCTDFGFHQEVKIEHLDEKSQLLLQAVFAEDRKIPVAAIKFELSNPNSSTKSDIKPDFMIIGAMKAATSAIYDYLLYHPRVIPRQPKELHFFSYNYDKGLDWYLSNFAAKGQKLDSNNWLIGEASPSYLNVKEVPYLVKKVCPDVKLIVSLRNPTDRAISQYYHHVKRVGDETRTIEEAFSDKEIKKAIKAMPLIDNDKNKLHRYINENGNTILYLLLGQYVSQLENWFEFFPKKQILILSYHDLENQPQLFIKQLFCFLNLQDYPLPDVKKVYANKYPSSSTFIKDRLNEYYIPFNQKLEYLINKKIGYFKQN